MHRDIDNFGYVPHARKVKHVKFFSQYCGYDGTINTSDLEKEINNFADENPSFKILGVRIEGFKESMIAVVTYLENAKSSGFTGEEDYYNGSYEERDFD